MYCLFSKCYSAHCAKCEGLKNSTISLEAFLPQSMPVRLEEPRAGWWVHLQREVAVGVQGVPCASLSPFMPI